MLFIVFLDSTLLFIGENDLALYGQENELFFLAYDYPENKTGEIEQPKTIGYVLTMKFIVAYLLENAASWV